MKQIYDFSNVQPPVLTEKMLTQKLEQKKLNRQITAVSLGSIFSLLCLFFTAVKLLPLYPLLSFIFIIYLCASVSGGCILILFISKKRRFES